MIELFDIEKMNNNMYKKLFKKLDFDNTKKYNKRFNKAVKYFVYKIIPKILTFASFIVAIYIFNWIITKHGYEKFVIIICVSILFLMNKINTNLNKLTS